MTKVVVKGTVMAINCLTTKAFLFIYNVDLFSNSFVCFVQDFTSSRMELFNIYFTRWTAR